MTRPCKFGTQVKPFHFILTTQTLLIDYTYYSTHLGAKAAKYYYYQQCPEEDLKTLIHQHGHAIVGVAVHGHSFNDYSSGVLEDCEYDGISKPVNHAVVAVGYGTENGVDYWLLKNSWGDGWGEKGFIKVKRGTCGIKESSCTSTTCVATEGPADKVPVKEKPATPSSTCNVLSKCFYQPL